jgi:two-component system response regulator AtoC
LNAVTLRVAPLRERTAEIESLAATFIREGCDALGRPALALGGDALQALLHHGWPGNIRELKNVIGRAVAQSTGSSIREEDLGLPGSPDRPRGKGPSTPPSAGQGGLHAAVEALEEERIKKALAACNFNRTKTAEVLGIARNTLASRMARFGIHVPERD